MTTRIILALALCASPALAQVVPTCGFDDTKCQCKLDPAFCPSTKRTPVRMTAMQLRLDAVGKGE